MPNFILFLRLVCLCGPLLLIFGCNEPATNSNPQPAGTTKSITDVELDDHTYMVELLANIADTAKPEENYHLNSARAESLQGTWEGVSDVRERRVGHCAKNRAKSFDIGDLSLVADH